MADRYIMRERIKHTIPERLLKIARTIKYRYLDGFALKSYSQEGEDMILRRIFERKSHGFYVDVGAHHPQRFSNTFYFYRRGWHGMNIDAMPNSMEAFTRCRPRDINIEHAISDRQERLTYYVFDDPALNSFSRKVADEVQSTTQYRVIDEIKMETATLEQMLEKHLPQGQSIDFLSVDVEGLDLQVLRSNDWSKYRPDVVLVEIVGATLEDISRHDISIFMKSRGYDFFAKTVNTVFFVDTHKG